MCFVCYVKFALEDILCSDVIHQSDLRMSWHRSSLVIWLIVSWTATERAECPHLKSDFVLSCCNFCIQVYAWTLTSFGLKEARRLYSTTIIVLYHAAFRVSKGRLTSYHLVFYNISDFSPNIKFSSSMARQQASTRTAQLKKNWCNFCESQDSEATAKFWE